MEKRIKKAYKFRIYPNSSQKQQIEKTLGCVRQVYNEFLEMCIEKHAEDPSFKLRKFDLIKILPDYKEGYEYLKEVDSVALQQAVIHLHSAYINFFEHRGSFPKFKSKRNDHSYTTMKINNNIRLDGNEIQIPKLGRVKVVVSRSMPESFSFTTVTISRVANLYFVTLTGEEDNPNAELFGTLEKLDVNTSIGLDFSLAHLYVDSDGNHADMPKYLQNDLKKLARLTRKASKCQKGSKNSIKAWQKVRKEQLHISNQRKDFLHKESRKIANKYDYVFVENLDLKSMQSRDAKMKMGRNVSDRAYGTFVNFLDYKLRWLGKELIKVGKYFASSKICSDCGYINSNLELNDRDWICPICGKKHDRDVNAAINIKKEGIRLVLQKQ